MVVQTKTGVVVKRGNKKLYPTFEVSKLFGVTGGVIAARARRRGIEPERCLSREIRELHERGIIGKTVNSVNLYTWEQIERLDLEELREPVDKDKERLDKLERLEELLEECVYLVNELKES
jgi:hypothetical protein